MSVEHIKIIDKLAWIELQDGQVLSTRSRGRTRYYLPGGKREAGEDDWTTLAREIREELSVALVPGSSRFLGVFRAQADSHPEGVLVQMTCYAAAYTGTISPASEIEEVVWLSYADRAAVSPVDQLIFDWLQAQGLLA